MGTGPVCPHASDDYKAKVAQREAERLEAERLKLLAETPEEKARREKKEAQERAKQERRDARWWDSYYARQEREEAKRSGSAYHKGRRKGSTINLDSQLSEGSKQNRLS
jgi:hypothetical protein